MQENNTKNNQSKPDPITGRNKIMNPPSAIKSITMTELKRDFEGACENYLKAFCDKHEYDYQSSDWVANDVGGFVEVGDLYIGMDDIRTDIDRDAHVDEFEAWYDYTMRLGMLGATYPNYNSWLNQCPIKTEEEIVVMEALREKIEGLQDELEQMCKS